MRYFYAINGLAQGPVSADDLFKLYHLGHLTGESFIIAENGTEWAEFATVFQKDAANKTIHAGKAKHETALFTLNRTGPIQVKLLPIKNKTAKAIVLEDFEQLPDGSRRRVLMRDQEKLPTTPAEAIRQFIGNQKNKIEEIIQLLEKEKQKLREAQVLLATHTGEEPILDMPAPAPIVVSPLDPAGMLPPQPPVSPAPSDQSKIRFPLISKKQSRHVF